MNKDAVRGEKVRRFFLYPFGKVFGSKPYAKLSAANLRKDPLNGAVSIIEKLIFIGLIPDFIRDKIISIPSLITHDVLTMFTGSGIERVVIIPDGIKLSYGIEIPGKKHPNRIKTLFIPFDKEHYKKKDKPYF